MATDKPEVVIRRARVEDYEGILEIGDVYQGRDYLRSMYFSFLEDRDVYPLVAEVDGKVVGFYLSQMIDGGLTYIKRAGRVHNSYRGQGIFHQLSEALDKHRNEVWPSIQYEVFATSDVNVSRAAKEFQEKGFKELVRKRLLIMHFKLKSLQDISHPRDFSQIIPMSYSDLQLLFTNNDVVKNLFPSQRILNFYVGYRVMESSIRHILNDFCTVYASTSASSPPLEECQTFSSETIEQLDILSCSHQHEANAGLIYFLDLYTVDGYKDRTLEQHLKRHLYDMRRLAKGDGVLITSFNSNVNETVVLSVLEEYGIVDFLPDTESYEIFYEKKL